MKALDRNIFNRRCLLAAVATCALVGDGMAVSPVSRGRQVLLNRGLQLQSLVFFDQPGVANIDFAKWKSANFTTINFWEAHDSSLPSRVPIGTQWSRQYVPPVPAGYLYAAELPYVKNLASLQYADELTDLSPAKLSILNTAYRNWNTNYPNAIAFTNFSILTSDADLASYIDATHPDMLSFDLYPQRYGTPLSDWYTNMQKYRTAALAGYTVSPGVNSGPLPYAQYLNTCRTAPDGALPTPSFIRLQQNASWAFGYTFTSAFVYNSYNDTDVSASMFNGKGDASPTVVFDYVKETNRQSRNLGPALVRLVSTDVRFVLGRHPNGNVLDADGDANVVPDRLVAASGATGWGNPYLKNVSVTNIGNTNLQQYQSSQRKLAGDVILGYFNLLDEAFDGPDVTGETYFMVVNGLTEPDGAAAADTRQQITLNFNFGTSGINSLQRLSRDSGLVESVPLVHDGGTSYHLDLTLDGGAGDLFKFNTGADFVSAALSTWRASGSGDWNDGANWSRGIPNGADAKAEFAAASATRTIFSEAAVTVGSLKFNSFATCQIAGNGSLSIDVTTGSGSISVLAGTHKINLPFYINDNTAVDVAAGAMLKVSDPMTIAASATLTKSGAGTLSIEAPVSSAGTGTLASMAGTTVAMMDLGNQVSVLVSGGEMKFLSTQHLSSLSVSGGVVKVGEGASVLLSTKALSIAGSGVANLQNSKLIVDYAGASPMANITNYLLSGKLMSSQAGGNLAIGLGEASDLFVGNSGLFAGEVVDSTSILARLTVLGDASLDGQVNSSDLNLLIANYGVGAAGRWTRGDFTGDGKVSTLDFNLLAANFGQTFAGATLGSVVPEPSSGIVCIAMLAAGLSRARRVRLGESSRRVRL